MIEKQVWRFEKMCTYGLNYMRSFITDIGPMVCEGVEGAEKLCSELLTEHGCPNSGIFLRFFDGSMEAVVVSEDEDEDIVVLKSNENNDVEFYATVDANYKLCCYGMIVEAEPDVWRVVEK